MTLHQRQLDFFRALNGAEDLSGVRGDMEVYRYAFFERIRASIEEDFPRLFGFLAELASPIGSEAITRALLSAYPPVSWTLAEASQSVIPTLARIYPALDFEIFQEATSRARLDEAENEAAWVEEWFEPNSPKATWVDRFGRGELALVRSKTWRVAGSKVFWRSHAGVQEKPKADFTDREELLSIVLAPTLVTAFVEAVPEHVGPPRIQRFLSEGIGEGWLRLTEPEARPSSA